MLIESPAGNRDRRIGGTCDRKVYDALPASTPNNAEKTENLGAADLVRTIRKEIRTAMNRGYTMEDIVSAAKSMGFDLSTPTLKKYIGPSVRKQRTTRGDTKKTQTTTVKRQPSEKPGAGVLPVQMPKANEL